MPPPSEAAPSQSTASSATASGATASSAAASSAVAGRAAEIADALIAAAKRAGAERADAVVLSGETLSVAARGGALETVDREEALEFGLRAMIPAPGGGLRQATVSASDPAPGRLAALAERAVAMAAEAPADPYADLAAQTIAADEAERLAAALDLVDPAAPPSPEALLDEAKALEAAALAVEGVTQAEGASAGWRLGWTHLATSAGVSMGYLSGGLSRSVSAVATAADGAMERDYAFNAARRRAALQTPEALGQEAGDRAVKRLGPRPIATGVYPVVFEPRVALSLLVALLGAVNGASIARGSSFLVDKMGAALMPATMDLIDDPLRPSGLGSRPFDGEGVGAAAIKIVDQGRLGAWLLDTATAAQLSLPTNGRASRGPGGPPRPASTTTWLTPGSRAPEALIGEIGEGLLVTEMMGGGVNPITGDYSRGASGFWIKDGAIAHPVSELTVAGAFLDMIADLEAANDLNFDRRINTPTLRVAKATVAANG